MMKRRLNVKVFVPLFQTILKEEQRIKWHIVGDGVDLERCKEIAKTKGLNCIIFHGRKPLEEMPGYYAMADAMLLTLMDDPDISRTLPGKVQTYMAAGKPILCAANGEVQDVIYEANCGYAVNAGDWQGLTKCVKRFLEQRGSMPFGENARKYYESHFAKGRMIDKLEHELEAACGDLAAV